MASFSSPDMNETHLLSQLYSVLGLAPAWDPGPYKKVNTARGRVVEEERRVGWAGGAGEASSDCYIEHRPQKSDLPQITSNMLSLSVLATEPPLCLRG